MSESDIVYHMEISFEPNDYDSILSALYDSGLNSFQEGRSVRMPDGSFVPEDEGRVISCYFGSEKEAEEFTRIFNSLATVQFTITSRAIKSNYLDAWKEHARPVEISDTLIIQPSWISLPKVSNSESENIKVRSNERLVIELDPGYAFGSGSHPTTILCARAIERLCKGQNREFVKNSGSLIDVGCGSGILSIIAKKLGVKDVLGIDTDPQAIVAAKENALKNGVTDITFKCQTFGPSESDSINRSFDIVVANILSSTLVDIYKELRKLTRQGGVTILSGVLLEEKDEFLKKIIEEKSCVTEKDGWLVIEIVKGA
ncbi:MAG TPA: 50S ribosomal protein L11 methyltransferase [Oligoflexia bacterium]|nr:50S ribosomal protein L11 methyltransferase [Oligoflexia bacterium]HMP47445.1 50S ribosomal protein L11 methyltransferase [Oligoflexia bacterium]